MRTIEKPKKGEVIVGKYILSENEVSFLQEMANDKTIGAAADTAMLTRRQGEHMMDTLQKYLNLGTRHGLIAYLIRTKTIK